VALLGATTAVIYRRLPSADVAWRRA
jgi:hypothetical protein